MLKLNDGRNELWQWDTGRTLSVDAECSQVHFGRNVYGRSIDVDVVDGVAEIPDVLLQTDRPFTAWAFVGTPENGYTKISKEFVVNKRNKPADYVFTQEEQITLRDVIKRLEDVEENQNPEAIAKIVNDYLEENPVESPVQSVNGKTGTVNLTAGDVGALPDDTQIPTVPDWVKPIPAEVGQYFRVSAVDENGNAAALEAVDAPSGGDVSDEGVVLLAETDALTENSTSIGITGLNLTEKSYVFRVTGTQDKIGNGLDVVINGRVFWNYTGMGKDVFVGFGLLNGEWIVKIYTENILSRSFRQVVPNFSGVLNSVELKPHYASDTNYINSGSKLMIYRGLFDAVLLAE